MNVNVNSVSTLSATAALEPTKFDATERGAFVRLHVQQVKIMVQRGRSVDDIKGMFPEFAENFPHLLEMLTRPGGYDEQAMGLMMRMLDTMGAGKTTQHEASIKVGQHLLDSYVKPQLE